MGELKVSINIKDGHANYNVHWSNPSNIDISVGISQLEILKSELMKRIKKEEVKWDITPDKD